MFTEPTTKYIGIFMYVPTSKKYEILKILKKIEKKNKTKFLEEHGEIPIYFLAPLCPPTMSLSVIKNIKNRRLVT